MAVMYPYILQLCGGNADASVFIDHFLNFRFVEAISCTYVNTAGLLTVGLIFYGGISIPLYIRTGDVRMPVVLLLLTGGAIVPQIAGPGLALATLALLLTGAGVLTLLYYRYSR